MTASSNPIEMQFYLMGERSAVMQSVGAIDLLCQSRIWAVAQQLRQAGSCIDIVPGMNNLTVIFDPELQSGNRFLERMQQLWETAQAQAFTSRKIQIPVRYGGQYGPDLELVAAHAGLSAEQVVAAHSSAKYLVYFLGFQPGFAYLGGLPAKLATPRRAEPRLAVPAGSVGIGGAQTGIYPAASPGGWQLIGRTDLCLFNPELAAPTLLQPGDSIEFIPILA